MARRVASIKPRLKPISRLKPRVARRPGAAEQQLMLALLGDAGTYAIKLVHTREIRSEMKNQEEAHRIALLKILEDAGTLRDMTLDQGKNRRTVAISDSVNVRVRLQADSYVPLGKVRGDLPLKDLVPFSYIDAEQLKGIITKMEPGKRQKLLAGHGVKTVGQLLKRYKVPGTPYYVVEPELLKTPTGYELAVVPREYAQHIEAYRAALKALGSYLKAQPEEIRLGIISYLKNQIRAISPELTADLLEKEILS